MTEQSTNGSLNERLIAILADVFQVELPAGAADVQQADIEEWDSFSHLRLIAELEDTFEISLSDDEVPEMTSLGKIATTLAQHGVS